MKKQLFKSLGVVITISLAFSAPASALRWNWSCLVECPYEDGYATWIPPSACCGPISPSLFTCPGGGQAHGSAYIGPNGPELCSI